MSDPSLTLFCDVVAMRLVVSRDQYEASVGD